MVSSESLIQPQGRVVEQDRRSVAYFQEVCAAAARARDVAGDVSDHFLDICGYTIRLCFAGSALVPKIVPALAHRSTKTGGTPDLTIRLWDSFSTGVPLPRAPWEEAHVFAGRGEMWGINEDRIHAIFEPLENVQFSILDAESNSAVYWVPEASGVLYYESGAPLRSILHWWMRRRGLQFVHAGAVGKPSGGVLVIGKGGSGKSTVTVACLDTNLLYAGDDYVLVSSGPVPFVYSLYNSAKLEPEHLVKTFPRLSSLVSNSADDEKALLFLQHANHSVKLASGFPIRAVVRPRITNGSNARLLRLSSASALAAIAPSTVFQLRWAGQRDFQAMSELVKQLPCYVLEIGTDLSAIRDAICSLCPEE